MEEVEELSDSFPDEVAEDVDGLLWLGFLEDTVEFCGHEFVIRTLKLEEEMLCSLVVKDYKDTISETKAWIAAQVAMALVSVDDDESFCPPAGPNKRDYARAKFNYVTQNWYEPTINQIYLGYLGLLQRQERVLKEMENLSQESRTTFTASPDSLNQRADSQQGPEIMEYLDQGAPVDLMGFNEDS